ncbi:hypothetical protein B6N60_04504 [Richelia sinica FACHB-800]|uniref:Uncharacterized protein n=1 Tax=Richelia sinica FACHB-800 TaxID=1357546 RepID=A0A975Y6Z7_9NOST|nr:hypothetical protein B6N60_04504 [Richelia sinica FACHB-800]
MGNYVKKYARLANILLMIGVYMLSLLVYAIYREITQD